MTEDAGWVSQAEQRLLDAAVALAPAIGWNGRLVGRAGRQCGLSLGETDLILPHGARDLAALLARRHDDRALAILARCDPAQLKIRERIARAVLARCQAALEDEAAVRRWSGFLALPVHAPLGLRLVWASADRLWRWAGDTATDQNHYSKRAILTEILASVLAIWLSSGEEAARRHLERRIGQVMAFERWKARAPFLGFGERLARRLGRWRYGAAPDEGGPEIAGTEGAMASEPRPPAEAATA